MPHAVPDPVFAACRAQFPSAERAISLDHASVGPISLRALGEMQRVAAQHALEGYQRAWDDDVRHVREQVSRFVGGAGADHVAFVQNTSFGISIAANGIGWRPGNNVVLSANEFPSNRYAWQQLAARDVEVRLVAAPAGHVALADLVAAIDGRTRAVALSTVQFSNGHRYDLAALGAACRERDVLFVVDGTQSIGALTIDVVACGIDVLAMSAHKWMLGPHGIGFVHLSDRALERIQPSVVGWLSVAEPFTFARDVVLAPTARRFEPGTDNTVGIVGLGGAIGVVQELGAHWVEDRVLALTDHLCDRARARGWTVVSPRTSPGERSGIVIVADPATPPDVSFARLTATGVRCAMRGGGIRFSPHCYNTTDELDTALAAMA